MNEINCTELNLKVGNNLSRAKGQLAGIEKMIADGRDSLEVVTQIQAVRAALSSIAIDLIKDECNECFKKRTDEDKRKQFEELVIKFFKIN